MNIDLPESFTMYDGRGDPIAWIDNGVLKLTKDSSFRRVMYEMTYQMKGYNRCFYCGKIFSRDEMTIDHMIPQERGGPTITNNLVPCCKEHNSKKSNMTMEQYMRYRQLQGKEKKLYWQNVRRYVISMKKSDFLELPAGWISTKRIKDIIIRFDFSQNCRKSQYRKVKEFYREYGRLSKPVIVDRRGFLLDGFVVLQFAKDYNLRKVPVIVLDNVEVVI